MFSLKSSRAVVDKQEKKKEQSEERAEKKKEVSTSPDIRL